EQQHAHEVRALIFTGNPNLLGQIVADERQENGIDQAIANERRQDARLETFETHLLCFCVEKFVFERFVLLELGNGIALELFELRGESEKIELILSALNQSV